MAVQGQERRRARTYRVLTLVAFAAAPLPAAAQTAAGTVVTNIATLTAADADRVETQVASNSVSFTVAERLDVTLSSAPDPIGVAAGGTATVPVTLTNIGNGQEAFVVAATAGARATIATIAIDADGNGVFDPARDTVLVDGRTPALAPGATLRLLVVLGATADPADGDTLTVTARAATTSGTPGSGVAGGGDNGGDAVVGATGATATVTRPFVRPGTPPPLGTPTLTKSATIAAPDGSARAVSGAAVTYVLTARFPAPSASARIHDPVPVGTRYLPGSLSLDGVSLTDAAGDDAGQADAAAVAVTLGELAGDAVRVVRFTVILP